MPEIRIPKPGALDRGTRRDVQRLLTWAGDLLDEATRLLDASESEPETKAEKGPGQ